MTKAGGPFSRRPCAHEQRRRSSPHHRIYDASHQRVEAIRQAAVSWRSLDDGASWSRKPTPAFKERQLSNGSGGWSPLGKCSRRQKCACARAGVRDGPTRPRCFPPSRYAVGPRASLRKKLRLPANPVVMLRRRTLRAPTSTLPRGSGRAPTNLACDGTRAWPITACIWCLRSLVDRNTLRENE